MAHYAIGDVQGCRAALEDLLERIAFDPAADRLFFAGDLVARGPDSLGTLRLIRGLGEAAESVLGNHDLHLIAARHGHARVKGKDGTEPVLLADDRDALMDWLQQRPLLLTLPRGLMQDDPAHRDDLPVLTHAGLPPQWDLDTAAACAREVEAALRGPEAGRFLADMYGNEPAGWSDDLGGTTRLRVITNYLTRMRLLHDDGAMDFLHKEELDTAPPGLTAWFQLPAPAHAGLRLLFGHWAALDGRTGSSRHVALDTGCVWGNFLTAQRLEDGRRFHSREGLQ